MAINIIVLWIKILGTTLIEMSKVQQDTKTFKALQTFWSI